MCAVHMNGRIYEPTLGRMLSPDPVTQAPDNGQNYNRYSYAFNNPLKYTDPSGYVCYNVGSNGTIVNDPLVSNTAATRDGVTTTGCPGNDAGFYYQDGSYSRTFNPILDSPIVSMGDAELSLGGPPSLDFSIGSINFWLANQNYNMDQASLVSLFIDAAIDGLFSEILAQMTVEADVALFFGRIVDRNPMQYDTLANQLSVDPSVLRDLGLSSYDVQSAFGHELHHIVDDYNGFSDGSWLRYNQGEASAYRWMFRNYDVNKNTDFLLDNSILPGLRKYGHCDRNSIVAPHPTCKNRL